MTYFTGRNNRFENNHYQLKDNMNYFTWMNGADVPAATWKGYGMDVNGTFVN
jgi:hypothetical protein